MGSIIVTSFASAEVLNISGEGKAPIGQNISVTREESLKNARRAAVVEAIKKMNGPAGLNDPKVQAAVDQIAAQIGNDKISDQQNSKDAANNFVTRVTLQIDETEFRKLLLDNGVASTTASNYKVLAVMDEFFTTKTDHTKPLRESVEYSHDKTATAENSLTAAESSSSAGSASSIASHDGAASYAGSGSSSGSVGAYGQGGGYSASGRQSASASGSVREKSKSASASTSQSSASASIDAKSFDQKKDVVNFKKLIEYQPQNKGPEKDNFTYKAILREANKSGNLTFKDNDVFRSKYFIGKPLTMEEMQNSSELSRYVAAAREDQADYFMVGNSIIINNDKAPGTNTYSCDGLVSLKVYATDNQTVIASDARNESAISQTSPDDCRVSVANKLAGFVGATLSSNINNYWKLKDMYGQEYNIRLVSLLGNLSDDVKDSFAEAVESIGGLQSKLNERKSTRSEYEVSIAYKGDKSVARAITSAVKKVPVFAKAERKVEGSSIKFCLEGPCPDK
jgi:hypothetical protein